jgi:hypothetical protein
MEKKPYQELNGKTDCHKDKRHGRPIMTKTDGNVEMIRTLVGTDRHLGVRMIAEELSVAKMDPKNLPVFNRKTNTNTRTRSALTRACPV